MESLARSPGAPPSWGSDFLLVCRFHRYWAYSSKSRVSPKMESCFQDTACSVSSFANTYPHPKSTVSYPSTSIFCSLKTQSLVLPLGLWSCCYCCLKCPLSRPVHVRLILVQFSVQMMPHQRPPLTTPAQALPVQCHPLALWFVVFIALIMTLYYTTYHFFLCAFCTPNIQGLWDQELCCLASRVVHVPLK